MEKIILPKGGGKTTELIKRSAESGDIIVCHSLTEADRIHNEAIEMGLAIRLPITYWQFCNNNYSKNIKGFLIDNVEMLLQYITNVPVNAITLNPY